MVAVVRARLPHRRLRGDRLGGPYRVGGLGEAQRAVEHRQPGAVPENVPDQHTLLAVRLELRPVPADRRVQVQQPAFAQHQHRGGGHALRRRPHDLGGVPLPRLLAVDVLRPGPQVHDPAPVPVHGERRTPLPEPLDVPGERLPDRFPPAGHRAVHLDVRFLQFLSFLPLAFDSGCNHATAPAIPGRGAPVTHGWAAPGRSAGRSRTAVPGGAPASAPRRRAGRPSGRRPRSRRR